jgi:aspartate racemase
MLKHIGIVAVSAEGAALCYRTICAEGAARFGPQVHPEVSMHTFPLADYVRHIEADRWDDVGAMLLASAAKLARLGAEFLICPDNTVHQGLDLVRHASPLPWLHIAEEVGRVATERGFRRLQILGTKFLMEGPVYPGKLRPLAIETITPPPPRRDQINAFIFDELIYGTLQQSTRSVFAEVIAEGQQRGCDAVVLGCTEIPLLIDDTTSPLPTLDSTRILARAALREAAQRAAPQTWPIELRSSRS